MNISEGSCLPPVTNINDCMLVETSGYIEPHNGTRRTLLFKAGQG